MKRIILKMGVLGVFCLVAGCSDDGSSSPLQPIADNDEPEVTSSSTAVEDATSSSAAPSADQPSSESKGTEPGRTDTTTIHKQVVITDSGAVKTSTYVSSGVFCWNAGCESKYSSATEPPKSSSSETIVFTESSASNEPPTVEGNTLKDNRDGKTYQLQNIAGKLWMAENLRYETSNGSFCSTEGGEDHCAKYGQYYTYSAAKRACPGGWRIPTAAEAVAADAEVAQTWWSIGGRFKVSDGKATEYGLDNEQGYIWVEAEGENNSFRVKNYSDDDVHELQSSNGEERAYNVRCVQE